MRNLISFIILVSGVIFYLTPSFVEAKGSDDEVITLHLNNPV